MDGRSVTSYFFGLLGATYAVYTALFSGRRESPFIVESSCVPTMDLAALPYLLESWDVAILFECGENDVDDPEAEEHGGRNLLLDGRTAQLTPAHDRTSAAVVDEDRERE